MPGSRTWRGVGRGLGSDEAGSDHVGDQRRARLRDERRLARGEVTPEQLQEENSLIPASARITIPDFCKTIERYYGK